MFVSLAEQMTALGQRRPITYSMKKINKSSNNSLMPTRNNSGLILAAVRGWVA
jgi:hypothetical protein